MNHECHSIDVKVTSSNSKGKGNNMTRAWGTKLREYKNEKNLHIVLIDTSGNIAKESWEYLLTLGINTYILRLIQKIIFECTSRKIRDVIEDYKYTTYKNSQKMSNDKPN